MGILKDRPVPRLDGIIGAAFCSYYGEVSEDCDGPIEWCQPVPEAEAEDIAGRFPELSLLPEPAHEEAFIHLGPGGQTNAAQWQLVSEILLAWSAERDRQPSELGVRVTFLATLRVTAESVSDCDFAVPVCRGVLP